MTVTLHHYWRSSCSWRVRAALDYKGIAYSGVAVDLLSGEQRGPANLSKNPAGFVPSIEINGETYFDSLSIMELLEELYPVNPILPVSPQDRAEVRSIAMIIAAGTQPIQNLKVQSYISNDPAIKQRFANHFIKEGLSAYERAISKTAGSFSFKSTPTIADFCLIPQLYNARRFGVDLTPFPHIRRVESSCMKLPCFQTSHPDNFKL
jgi:maleylacetoacetate isomerase